MNRHIGWLRVRGPISALALICALAQAGSFVFAQPASLRLSVQGDRFAVNGNARFLIFISYFDAMRRAGAGGAAALAADMAFFKPRVDGIRIMANWWDCTVPRGCGAPGSAATDSVFDSNGVIRDAGNWRDPRAPNPWDRFITVLRAARDNGLLVDVTFTIETIAGATSLANYRAGIARVVSRLAREEPALSEIVLFDVANELNNNLPAPNFPNAEAVIEAILAVNPHALVTASQTGASGALSPSQAGVNARKHHFPVVTFHERRGGTWYDENTISAIVDGIRQGLTSDGVKPIALDEPTKWQQDPTVDHFSAAATSANKAGAALWTFHTESGYRLAAHSMVQQMSEKEKEAVSRLATHAH
jgi:hypothetical protein